MYVLYIICIYLLYVYMYYMYIYMRFHIESWPEWDLNSQPRAYHAHALTTELSGRTMGCA